MASVLFICLGNICRSPMAEGIFRFQVDRDDLSKNILVDSAGTGSWHIGNPPDPRAKATAIANGVDISGCRARQISLSDFDQFDFLICMDTANKMQLLEMSPPNKAEKIEMMSAFSPEIGITDVPDPYYGDAHDFKKVFDLIDKAAAGLLAEVKLKL